MFGLALVLGMSLGCALSVQNGVAKNEQLAAVFGRETVVGAASKVSGEMLGSDGEGLPGSVLLTIAGETVVSVAVMSRAAVVR